VTDDRLARWAAERAPTLFARAEEEAVAELKALLLDALVERPRAARERPRVERRSDEHRPPPASRATRKSRSAQGEWIYAVMREGDGLETRGLAGVQGAGVRAVAEEGLVALASPVPLSEFGEEELKRNLNDLEWLEEVARAHERVVDRALERGPVIPLRLCTIYQSEDRVRSFLATEGPSFRELLDRLEGREEWSVKLFVDPDSLRESIERDQGEPAPVSSRAGAGGAYLARRRSDRAANEAADRLARELAEEVHARLQDWAIDAVVGRPQNPDLSGHTGQMLLNGAYLVDRDRVERFQALVAELQDRHRGLGARVEASGPWPPYNFIPREP
jgi:Gas vesicle synthesis protein GvpL/GvpF